MSSSGGSGLAVVLVSGVLVSWCPGLLPVSALVVSWMVSDGFPVVPGPGVLRVGGGGF